MGAEDSLDLGGIDVLTTANNDILYPANNHQVALLIKAPQITTPGPAILIPGLPRALGVHKVTGNSERAAQYYLTRLTCGHVISVFIDNSDLTASVGLAQGEMTHLLGVIYCGAGERADILYPKALKHDGTDFFLGLLR